MARILVIDDELVIRQALAIMLANVGHKVETAENGRAGLDMLERESFDLVLTDILMPEMDGVEAMRKLRALPSPPKIVAMSGGVQLTREDFLRQVKARLRPGGCMLANIHVLHDFDPAPDRFAFLVERVWRDVRLLDGRGIVHRNAIVMAGAVASLVPPTLVVAPDAGSEEIVRELARLAFRPWQQIPR